MLEVKECQCVICQANFPPQVMVGNKCKQCTSLYPNAESLDDLKDKNQERARLLNEPVIREIIYEVLEEAGIKRKRCEICRSLFFSKSPATKFCDSCKANAAKAKEVTEKENE